MSARGLRGAALAYIDGEEQNADWLKTKRLGWWTPERVKQACALRYKAYLRAVRARHTAYYQARPAERSTTHAFAARSLAHALPPGRASLANAIPPSAWHRHHLSGGSSQVLAVSLLATGAEVDGSLAWLGIGDLGRITRTSFEVTLSPETLNERPYSTTIDWLVESDDFLIATEAKFTEHGMGTCRCKGRSTGQCSSKVMDRPYWEVARDELGLEGPRHGVSCQLGFAYQAVRNVAAARALADGRQAIFILLHDARNPYFTRVGAWPGWPMLLSDALASSAITFYPLAWQRLVAHDAIPTDVRIWATEKHGFLPA
jgi:hypothetical protein